MALAETDKPILNVLFSYRYLQSGQIARLTGRSSQVIRRAIRKRLIPGGYVVPMVRELTEEAAYALGREGFELMAYERRCPVGALPFSRKVRKTKSYFWKHTLLTNNVRIAFDIGAREHERVVLSRAVPEWEMENPQAKKPEKKFLLYDIVTDESDGREHSFRPDALFLIHPQEDPNYQIAYFLESDRGTEDVNGRIKNDKFIPYRLYFDQLFFHRRYEANDMRCLFVLEAHTAHRIRTMQGTLQRMARELEDEAGEGAAKFVQCFRFALAQDISARSVYDDAVWQDWKGEGRALVKREPSK